MSKEDLRKASRDVQLEAMEKWFRQNFEDPAANTSHDSAEGGYLWTNGGPYDAEEELREEFEGIVPDEVIMALVSKLEQEGWLWAPVEGSKGWRE